MAPEQVVFDTHRIDGRRRGTCGQCGKRRLVTDYIVEWGVPAVGVSLCAECDDLKDTP